MAANPNFAATPRIGVASISTANAARDGTGTIGTVITAGAGGTRIRAIHIRATGVTTAGMVRLYLHDGATAHLLDEVPVSAVTPGPAAEAFGNSMTELTTPELLPLTIPTGWSLRASTNNGEAFRVAAEGADL